MDQNEAKPTMKQDNNGKIHQEKSQRLIVSLKTLSNMLDAHRSSVRRWLKEAGIKPIALGQGRNGAIRYRWRDVNEWLESLKYVE
jgi:hypothetical protein